MYFFLVYINIYFKLIFNILIVIMFYIEDFFLKIYFICLPFKSR